MRDRYHQGIEWRVFGMRQGFFLDRTMIEEINEKEHAQTLKTWKRYPEGIDNGQDQTKPHRPECIINRNNYH